MASEMRRLAERVGGVVDDVAVGLAAIERASGGSEQASEASIALARETSSAAEAILTVSTRQSGDTRQAAALIDETAAMVRESVSGLGQARAVAETLRSEAGELEVLIGDFKLG